MAHYLSFLQGFVTSKNLQRTSWTIIVLALLSLVFNILKLTSTVLRESYFQERYSNVWVLLISSVSIITAMVAIVGGYGMHKYKEWGRQTTIIALIASFLIFAVNNWHSMQSNQPYVPLLAPLAFFFLLLYLLSRPETLKLFSSPQTVLS